MNRLLAPLLAAASLTCVAAPVLAQPLGPSRPLGGQGIQLEARADQLEQRIRRGMGDGGLDRREAERALDDLGDARRLQNDLLARNRGVLSPADRQLVAARLDELERSLRWLRNNDRVGQGAAVRPDDREFRYGFGREFWTGAPQGLNERLAWVETRVRRGMDNGSLTRAESQRAFGMLRDFRRMQDDLAARNGGRLSRRDRETLMVRLDTISQQIQWLRRNDRRR